MATTDRPLDWGASRKMTPLEALMWRAEFDPRLRSTIVAVEILETAPEWERFRAAHDWGSRMVPRFRQRVVEPGLGLGQPTWVVDPGFDLSYHLRRLRLAEPTYGALMEAAQTLAMTPFDKARAPWEAVLFDGLPDGRAAYVLKMHHSATDGIGMAQLLGSLHSRTSAPNPDKPQPPPPAPETVSHPRELARQALRDAQGAARMVRRAGGSLGALRRPDRVARDTAGFAASLRRVLSDPGVAPSPLLAGRSLSWRFLALDCAFADLRGAAKAHDCSLNDAFLAALLGAFRIYHAEHGSPIEAMPIGIPVSVRRDDDEAGGNRFAGVRLAGPVGIADPRERMLDIRRRVRAVRAEPAMDALSGAAGAVARLPGPLIAELAGGLTKGSDLQASNVPGLREEMYLAGARIELVFPFAPLPGCAAMITLVSHGDRCCIGANVDAAAITDLDGFGRALAAGFDEVLALAPGAEPAVRRV